MRYWGSCISVFLAYLLIVGCHRQGEDAIQSENKYSYEDFVKDSLFVHDIAFPMYERGYVTLPNYDTMYIGARMGVDAIFRMLEHRKDSHTVAAAGTLLLDTGFGQLFRGEFDSVTLWYDKALVLLNDHFGEGHISTYPLHISYAAYYDQKKDHQKALEHGHKALHIANTQYGMQTRFPGAMHWNIGLIYENIEDYENATRHYLKSAEHFEGLQQHAQLPRCYDRIGSFHLMRNEFDEAMTYFQKMHTIRQTLNVPNDLQVISGLYRIASVHLARGDWELGEAMMRNIPPLPAVTDIGRQYFNISSNFQDIGDIYQKNGRYNEALSYFHRVLELEQHYSGPHHPRTAKILNRIRHSWLLIGDADSTLHYAQLALCSLYKHIDPRDLNSNPTQPRTILGYDLPDLISGKASGFLLRYRQKGNQSDLVEAFNLYSQAESIVHHLRREYAHDQSKQTLLEKTLPIFEGGVITALNLYDLTKREEYLSDAFAISERSKAMILQDALQSSQQRKYENLPSEVIEKGRAMKIDLAFYQMKKLEEEEKGGKADTIRINRHQDRIVALQSDIEKWESEVKRKWPEYFSSRYETEKIDVKSIQGQIDNETALIEYFISDSILFIFTLTHDGLDYTRRSYSDRDIALINHFRQSVMHPVGYSDEAVMSLTNSGYHLYHWLLYGLSGVEGKGKLIIIPDGILGYIPFGSLIFSDQDRGKKGYRHQSWLINKYQIRQSYSAALLTNEGQLRSKKGTYAGFAPQYGGEPIAMRNLPDSLLIVRAFNDPSGNIPGLKYNIEEVEESARAFKGAVYTGLQAGERAFKEASKRKGILHLAMHAVTDDERPDYSQLIFTSMEGDTMEDGRLHAYELYNMELDADLAILSACNTGAGKLLRGEGVMSLARAFRYAGCPNIMMSLWPVSDASTRDLIVGYCKELQGGIGKSEALRQAQVQFVKNADERYTHPYYWGAFTMVGDDKAIIASEIQYGWFGMIAFLIGALILWWRTRKS